MLLDITLNNAKGVTGELLFILLQLAHILLYIRLQGLLYFLQGTMLSSQKIANTWQPL
ncbi:hypothetical protein D3C85_1829390 [compost metagenome]